MSLDLDLTPRTRGRAAKQIAYSVERELTAEDINSLQKERGITSTPLAKLRDRHHTLARLIAGGASDQHCVAVTGYVGSRISILKSDPAFQELVAFYRAQVDEKYFDMHEQIAGLSADALLELRERLEEDAESFSINQLLEIMTKGADRVGFGPSSKTEVNVNVGIADRMDAARNRMKNITPLIEG